MRDVDVLMVTWPGHAFARRSLRGLIKWHESKGHSCRFSHMRLKRHELPHHYRKPTVAYVWNGAYSNVQMHVNFLRGTGALLKFVEIAWFPQGRYIYIDDKGTNGDCSLFDSDLSWVGPEHYAEVDRLRQSHLEGRTWVGKGGYIACPLQLKQDTQISKFSPIKNMTDFMDHCEKVFPNDKLQFKKHPKDHSTLGPRCFKGGDLHEWLSAAKLVYGINSTVLLEAALMGAPVVTIGKSLLNTHEDQDKALAALAAKQIPMGESDLDKWAEHPDLGLHLPL